MTDRVVVLEEEPLTPDEAVEKLAFSQWVAEGGKRFVSCRLAITHIGALGVEVASDEDLVEVKGQMRTAIGEAAQGRYRAIKGGWDASKPGGGR